MAEGIVSDSGGGHGRHQKQRAKKLSTRIDMTPMVDLGFLLLTFFMLTTTFSQPKVIEITPPVKNTKITEHIQDSLALTLVLSGSNKIYYYNGILNMKPDSNNIHLTDFSDNGLRKILLNRNWLVLKNIKPLQAKYDNHQLVDTTFERLKEKERENANALFVVIKTDSLAKYVNVVNTFDELIICNVGKYSTPLNISPQEREMIADYNKKHNIK